ncbi:MAG: bifunctional phosphoserine phosphatase/homoserine phosphotransferase ThrH, partial [Pseudomonadales bacterium]
MNVLCLDLEGVLIPEIWLAVAAETGIEALERTTRDEPVYDKLMRYRLDVLEANDLPLSRIERV